MKNSNLQLAELKESNINQLVASEMFMIRGGGKSSKKKSKKSSKKNRGHRHTSSCCCRSRRY